MTHEPFKLTSLNNVFPAQLAMYMSAIKQRLAIKIRIIGRVKRLLGPLCFGLDNVFPVLFRTSVVLLNFLLKLNFPNVSIGFLGGRRKFRPVLQRNWGNIPISPVTRPVFLMVHSPERPSPEDPKLRNPIVMSSPKKSLTCKKHLYPLRA